MTDDPDADAVPDDGRDETENERLDRNFSELLQELRVTQTGTQILTGFLLTVAFQARFDTLDPFQVDVYLVLVVLSIGATILGLAPVRLHRARFRRGEKARIVRLTARLLDAVLLLVAGTLAGTVLLLFDVVTHRSLAVVVASCTLVALVALWYVLPIGGHRSGRPSRSDRR